MIEIVYCENEDCRVYIYSARPIEEDGDDVENCPGCGRFGRLKGDQD